MLEIKSTSELYLSGDGEVGRSRVCSVCRALLSHRRVPALSVSEGGKSALTVDEQPPLLPQESSVKHSAPRPVIKWYKQLLTCSRFDGHQINTLMEFCFLKNSLRTIPFNSDLRSAGGADTTSISQSSAVICSINCIYRFNCGFNGRHQTRQRSLNVAVSSRKFIPSANRYTTTCARSLRRRKQKLSHENWTSLLDSYESTSSGRFESSQTYFH